MMGADRIASLHGILREMATLSRVFEARGAHPFKDRALGRRQMDVMFYVSQSGQATVGQIAHALGVTSGAVSQVLPSLEVLELISTRLDPADRRTRLIGITPAAAAEVESFQNAYVETLLPAFAELTAAELDHLRRLLTKVRKA